MKFILYITLALFSLSLHAISVPISEVRSFTRASDKKTLDASIVSYDGKQVTLKIAGKKNHTLDPVSYTHLTLPTTPYV